MIRKDDRTPEQKLSHTCLIVGTDSFMSWWGEAKGGLSYAAWACKPEHRSKVLAWVSARKEMKRVREVSDPYYPKSNICAHLHIYVVDDKHPSIR